MTILDVVQHPNPVLREKAAEVTTFDKKIQTFIEDLYDTMAQYNGIGLAAPQVGVLQRIFVIGYEGVYHEFINPVLSNMSGQQSMNEGCLSIPGIQVPVDRYEKLTIKAQNRHGKTFTLDVDAMVATIIQHENDHLEGVLIIDKNLPIEG
ncbi:MAG: peptide deformylase [bacterium]